MIYEECLGFTDSSWNNLTEDEKVEVLQTIENHMAFESGRMNCPVEAQFLYTGNDGVVLGTYDPDSRTILVNASQFDSESMYGKTSEAMITACIHEGRHAYQHQVAGGMVEHDNVEEAEAWRDNLSDGHYISFRENPRAYYNQPVEVDARKYSEWRYNELLQEKEQLQNKNEVPENHAKDIFTGQINALSEKTSDLAADYHQCDKNNMGW